MESRCVSLDIESRTLDLGTAITMGNAAKELLKVLSKGSKENELPARAIRAALVLAKGVLNKPGLAAQLEYRLTRAVQGWTECEELPLETLQTADTIATVFNERRIVPTRIAVDGVPGSGKSSLAAALSRKLGMSITCLDHHNMDKAINFDSERTIFEQHRLLRTQDIDRFDAIVYLDEPVEISKRKILQRKRGGYLVEIMNFGRLKAIGLKAFSTAAGEHIRINGSFARVKIRPEGGFRSLENIERELLAKGLSGSGLSKEQKLFLCVEGRPASGFGAYINPRAFNRELLDALGSFFYARPQQRPRPRTHSKSKRR